jgi:hypothetical protein
MKVCYTKTCVNLDCACIKMILTAVNFNSMHSVEFFGFHVRPLNSVTGEYCIEVAVHVLRIFVAVLTLLV